MELKKLHILDTSTKHSASNGRSPIPINSVVLTRLIVKETVIPFHVHCIYIYILTHYIIKEDIV